MKDAEDEAFDELARKQGSWGGGFPAKRKMAADKLQEPYDQTALELCNVCGWKTLIPDDGCLNCERAQPAQLERQPLTNEAMELLLPSPDGSAESDVKKVEVLPGVFGQKYEVVDAWSKALVFQFGRDLLAAHNIGAKP
jgi:hypothetical protein